MRVEIVCLVTNRYCTFIIRRSIYKIELLLWDFHETAMHISYLDQYTSERRSESTSHDVPPVPEVLRLTVVLRRSGKTSTVSP